MSPAAIDLIALLVLLLFVVWGAVQGSLRQLASLVVLFVAFPGATRFGPRIEGSVVKAVTVSGGDLRMIAWAVVFLGVLLAGGVLVALCQPLLGRLARGERGLGALLGLLHGCGVLTLLVYAFLVAFPGAPRPRAIRALLESHAMVAAREIRGVVAPALVVPPWMERRLEVAENEAVRPPGG
jgi:uncharacterized membrane protein required for colicin V production